MFNFKKGGRGGMNKKKLQERRNSKERTGKTNSRERKANLWKHRIIMLESNQ
jgi:hypothetical protein